MLNYGGSLTSAFPTSFCSSPSSIVCQLCNNKINDSNLNQDFFRFNKQTLSSNNCMNNNHTRLEKCTHCGLNICDKCLNDNHESVKTEDTLEMNGLNISKSHYNLVKKEFKQMYNYSKDIVEKLHLLNNAIKIEESAVSELNLIKHQVNTKAIELIKQINQEKNDLIEQIENVKRKYESTLNERKEYFALSMQFKDELKKVIRKYKEFKLEEKCSLNDLLNLYFPVKNITKSLDDYDHIKLITEQDPLQVMFEERPMYRNLIGKLILNQKYHQQENLSSDEQNEVPKTKLKSSSKNTNLDYNINSNEHASKQNSNTNEIDPNLNQTMSQNKIFNHYFKLHIKNKAGSNANLIQDNNTNLNKDLRSFSLNDLINAANEILINNNTNNTIVNNNYQESTEKINSNKNNKIGKSNPNLYQNKKKEDNTSNSDDLNAENEDNYPEMQAELRSRTMPSTNRNKSGNQQSIPILKKNNNNQEPFFLNNDKVNDSKPHFNLPHPPPSSTSAQTSSSTTSTVNLKNSSQSSIHKEIKKNVLKQASFHNSSKSSIDADLNKKNSFSKQNLFNLKTDEIAQKSTSALSIGQNSTLNKQNKQAPKQRLEIDILPSHLNCSKNKLLISSSYGKIRVVDLFSYKIQKDELKNLSINGICMPKSANNNKNCLDNEILYAVTNAQMNPKDDLLNVSNSAIIVTKRELKVLKLEDSNPNDDYVFLNPTGICYDVYDNLYICDSGYNRIKVLDKNLNLLEIIETGTNQQDRLSQPKSVCTHDNILYICDSGNHRIVSYNINDEGKAFKFKSIFGYGFGDDIGMLKYPLECCADSNGLLYVRDHHNNRVQVFGPDSNPMHYIEVNSQQETIYSMTVNENGDVYVAKMVHATETDKNGQLRTINKYYIDIY